MTPESEAEISPELTALAGGLALIGLVLGANVVKKLFQTYPIQIGRFHDTRNGSQLSAERGPTTYTFYYSYLRRHNELNGQPPVEYPDSI